jgi:hypothetical protein
MDTNSTLGLRARKSKRGEVEYGYYATYKYRGVPYVPHYTKPDCYIPPGYTYDSGMADRYGNRWFTEDSNKEFSASQLEKAGAIRVPEYLMKRSRYQELL